MSNLIERRRLKRTDATRTINRAMHNLDSQTREETKLFISRIDILRNDLRDLDGRIFESKFASGVTEEESDAEYNNCTAYEENMISAMLRLRAKLETSGNAGNGESVGGNSSEDNNRTIVNKISIPQLPLPTYGHTEGEDLTKFFAEFEQIVNKYSLSEFERYVYLKNQVSNEPAILLESLDSANRTYTSAKALLEEAFASEVLRKFNAIDSLSKLKLEIGDDPYKYISSMRQITQVFTSLQINVEDVQRYFIWTGLNDMMKNQLIAITNENRPSLLGISSNIFVATERYNTYLKNAQSVKSKTFKVKYSREDETFASAVAVNDIPKPVKTKGKFCSLCSVADNPCKTHSTYECPVFPTPSDKLAKLKQLGGCFKCGNTNHTANRCRFRFERRCRECSKFHFSYLCTGSGKFRSITSNNSVNVESVFIGKTSADQYGKDSIIPSFSVTIQKQKLRVMRDSGCQPNIITQKTADKLKLKIIREDFPLNIKGFMANGRVDTNIVLISLVKNHPPITAICVPEINVNINLPGLNEVVDEFSRKGYKLADEFLFNGTDVLGNFDFILGNIDAQILCQTERTFGTKPCSMYADTPFGTVLYGGIERILKNVKSLPFNKSSALVVQTATTKKSNKKENFSNFSDFFAFKVSVDSCNLIDNKILDEAVDDIVQQVPNLIYDSNNYPDNNVENDSLNKFVLKSTTRANNGRLTAPLLWNEKMSHNLGTNFNLSKAVLHSNLNRLKGDANKLKLYDDAIKDHVDAGVLEEIPDFTEYLKEHPAVSFVPHSPVFRMDKESTKCRVVLLSNLVQKGEKNSISHNQAMLCGANLNSKISTALTKLRFDSYVLVFDIQKAFLNISLREADQDKLAILSYKRVAKDQCKLVAYKYTRLPFGLRCSPAILLLCMYKILVEDSKSDIQSVRDLKCLIYDLTYMDNCALSSNDLDELKESYLRLDSIFNPYQFKLQQFATNESGVSELIREADHGIPGNPVKLLGMWYDTDKDTLFTEPIKLDGNATTKRKVLASIAKNYDVLQINCPLLNRARIFIHALQCQKGLNWDDKLSKSQITQWVNICKQSNNAPSLRIDRSFGPRDGTYELIAFTDASKLMLGTVLYLKNVETNTVTFLASKNLMVSKQIEGNTIPSLELHAISHGVKNLTDTYQELCGNRCMVPINIVKLKLYSDSMVALAWVNGHANKLDKMQKLKTFVLNRLLVIRQLCDIMPVEFHFIAGKENPADMVTRAISYKLLCRTCYLTGPQFLRDSSDDMDDSAFVVPNPWSLNADIDADSVEVDAAILSSNPMEHLVPLDKYSDLFKLLRINRFVHEFVNKLKKRIGYSCPVQNLTTVAYMKMIKTEQSKYFSDIIDFFNSKSPSIVDTPSLINKYNLFLDCSGVIRVRSKFKEWKLNVTGNFPILLPRDGILTKMIIVDLHARFSHSGNYCVIAELRRDYFIPKIFSTVKAILSDCLICRRVNARTVKSNQSFYREFRENPATLPFQYSFMDHFGPYHVYVEGKKRKVWVLIITCLWSRSINLKVAYDMSVKDFLRCLQLHIYEYGIPERIFSDLGSQLVAGGNIVSNLLKQPSCLEFFETHNMKPTTFEQYPKGRNELGSLVESCVKISKRLINGSIRNNVLKIIDFELLISQTVHLANKRPIAFQNSLRNTDVMDDNIPAPITPEILTRGYDTPSLSILPCSNNNEDLGEWCDKESNIKSIKLCSDKLQKVRYNIKTLYHEEFLGQLVDQAVSRNSMYKKVTHKILKPGDVVLIKEEFLKSTKYPMGRITKTTLNDLGEVTTVEVKKGNGEIVKRDVSSIIPYMELNHDDSNSGGSSVQRDNVVNSTQSSGNVSPKRPKRKVASIGQIQTKKLFSEGLA